MLAENMPKLKSTQHSNSNNWIQIDGDVARARTICFNPMVRDDNGTDKITVCGLWYVDTLVRTPDGWRIRERVEEASYLDAGGEPAARLTTKATNLAILAALTHAQRRIAVTTSTLT